MLYRERTTRSKGTNNFNGSRLKPFRTAEGDLELQIPKMRKGSYFPEFLKRWDKTSIGFKSIIANAYFNGVSTRKMTHLFSDLGMDDVDKSMVSRVSSMLEDHIDKWFKKPLDNSYSCVWLDATYTSVLSSMGGYSNRLYGKSIAVLVAIAVNASGQREVLNFKICDGESKANWQSFLEDLKEKGLERSELWVSDDHKGLRKALMESYTGQPHQRCMVHWRRNLKNMLPQEKHYEYLPLASNSIKARSIDEFDEYYDSLIALSSKDKNDKLNDFLKRSRVDITSYQLFPPEYWSKIRSTNIIERLNKELRARERPISVFMTYNSIKQIYGYILMIQDKAWSESGEYLIAPKGQANVLDYMRDYSKIAIPKSSQIIVS